MKKRHILCLKSFYKENSVIDGLVRFFV